MIAAFVLTFADEVNRDLTAYSQSFRKSRLSLDGEAVLPHATLAQFDLDEAEAKQLWREFESVDPGPFSCSFAGLCLLPTDTGEVWVEIPVLGGKDLVALQEALLALPTLSGRRPYNGTGRSIRPHVTVGLYDEPRQLPKRPSLPPSLLRMPVQAKVAMGPTGEHFSFAKAWFTSDK